MAITECSAAAELVTPLSNRRVCILVCFVIPTWHAKPVHHVIRPRRCFYANLKFEISNLRWKSVEGLRSSLRPEQRLAVLTQGSRQ